MTGPALLYCVGATKAGTSWLYRALHDHPDCALPAVKEVHYWDTADPDLRDKQIAAFRRRLEEFHAIRAEAADDPERAWQVANMDRRIADMTGLIAVIAGDRTGDRAYLDWMTGRAGDRRLVADMTPAYALLPAATFARMAAAWPMSLFVLLIRDPLARLWSHVRMQAERQKRAGEEFAQKANNTMWRILNRGQETHILHRGDYADIAGRLRAGVPADRLRIAYMEDAVTEDGQRAMAEFLGIGHHPADGTDKAHEGPRATLRDDLAAGAVRFLRAHYDWAARNVGPLPQAWKDSLALAG